jgi:hypothetical protein
MAEPKRHVYESTTLGLPPLKMVLVHARNEAQNAAQRPSLPVAPPAPAKDETPLDRERAVRRIIEHLQEIED